MADNNYSNLSKNVVNAKKDYDAANKALKEFQKQATSEDKIKSKANAKIKDTVNKVESKSLTQRALASQRAEEQSAKTASKAKETYAKASAKATEKMNKDLFKQPKPEKVKQPKKGK